MRSIRRALALLACAALVLPASAQSVNVTRGILADQPYTLIYPDTMTATGAAGEPMVVNHPDAPLQCELAVVPVEDTDWTPQEALAGFDPEAASAEWAETFEGFSITETGIAEIQGGEALFYAGESTDSPMGMPITLVHVETVAAGRGYLLDCLYASAVAENARPIVDFIVANFATRSDAGCCVGAEPLIEDTLVAPD